jgi:hypothetical protein
VHKQTPVDAEFSGRSMGPQVALKSSPRKLRKQKKDAGDLPHTATGIDMGHAICGPA